MCFKAMLPFISGERNDYTLIVNDRHRAERDPGQTIPPSQASVSSSIKMRVRIVPTVGGSFHVKGLEQSRAFENAG